MKNYRIVERTYEDGERVYIIQKKFLLWWIQYEDSFAGYIYFKDYEKAENYYNRISPKTYTDKIVVSRKEKLEKLLS